tara:strand:+ start:539 stop:994 length:456 start_codon:yes stop_codon:yes gene_type:complete
MGADISAVTTTALFRLGSSFQDYDGKIYKYMQYDEATAATAGVAGEVAYYVAGTGYGANACTSDLSDADTTPVGAGVLQANMNDSEYGWFQIKGPATLSIALTAGADGNALTPTGAGDGTLDVVVTTVALCHICAYAGDASANEIMCDFLY